MTIVEFFDDEALDNAMGAILLKPERLVVLYAAERCDGFVKALDKILKKRNIKTEIFLEKVDISTIDGAKAKLEELVKRFPDCDFDIAGGSDIMLVAIGEIAKKYSLPLHCVDVRKRSVNAVGAQRTYEVFDTALGVNELIDLHGGRCSNETREKEACVWERNIESEKDIEKIWDICKMNPAEWNSTLGKGRGGNFEKSPPIWNKLRMESLVYKHDGVIRFKNDLIRYLLARQGTALEMYTFICAKAADYFDDGQSGALLDWKGRREVENEIDVLLTKGAVGYFISCKNGMVDSDELYTLNTVASRFGGRYAKKILVLSFFEPDRSFMQRADALGIKVIKNARYLKKKDLAKRLMI